MQSQSESYKSKFKAKFNSTNSNSQQQPQRRELHRQQQQRQHQPLQLSTSATTVTKSTAEAERSETAAAVGGNHSSKSTTSLPHQQRRATVKVIKCKKPLCHFKFYLDICDHQLAKRIEEQIRTLGGALEFFLTANVTHFITDKAILPTIVGGAGSNNNINNNNNSLSSRPGTPQTPGTPKTPQTPYAGSDTTTTTLSTKDGKNNVLTSVCNTPTTGSVSRKSINTRQTRANAILNRVRRASTTTTPNKLNTNSINVNAVGNFVERTPNSPTITTPLSSKDVKNKTVVVAATPPIIISTENPYIIWRTEYALHFFKKVQHELKDYLGNNNNNTHIRHEHAHAHKILYAHKGGRSSTVDPIDLKGGGFLKIESIKRNYRPYYQLFRKSSGTEWPKIELTREDGAFRLSPKKKQQPTTNVKEVIAKAEAQKKERQKVVKGNHGSDDDEKELNMTRKSRSRSSQNQKSQPINSAVKSLKKSGAPADSAAKVKSSQRNSQAGVGGGGAGAAAAGCKQAKESSDKQCGVCEICKIEYDTLTIHLKTKDHEYFAKNSQNFIALDSLIHTSADVNKFLSEDKKVTDLEEMEVENFEVMADENAPDPLEGSDPLVGGATAEVVVLPASLIALTDDKRRLTGGAHHTPSPTLREKSKRSTKGKHSSEKFQNIRLSKSPKSTKSATSPIKQNLAAATCTTTATNNIPAPTSSSMLELQNIAATAESANAVKTLKTAKSIPARRKTISASALSPPIRAMLPPSSLYKVVGTPETSVYGTPTRKVRGGELQSGVGGGDGVHDASVTASPSLIVKFKKVRTTELNRLNGEAESFMFPKQRTSSELPTDVDRQTTSENAHGRSSSSTSLDTSTSDGECSMDVEECSAGRMTSSKTTGVKQQTGKRAIATAKRRKDSKAKGVAATKQRFPSAPIQPEIQLKDKQETRKSATALSKSQQTAAETSMATKTTSTTTKMSRSVSNVSNDSPPGRRPSAAISAAAAKANLAAAALAAITLPEATRKSSRTATAIVTAATTSSRLLRAAVEAAKYNCRQMAVSNERLPLVSNGRKISTASANEVAASTMTKLPMASAGTITASTTKSFYKRVPVVKKEDRMGDLRNKKKKKVNTKSRSRSDSDLSDEDDEEEDEHALSSKCIKSVKQNTHLNKDLEVKTYGVTRRGVDNDDDDDEDDDDEEVDNDDDKDEDYVHCIRSRRKSVNYDNLSALWQRETITTSSALSRKQRAAQREEQKYKMSMLTTAGDNEGSTATNANEIVKVGGGKRKNSNDTPTKTMKLNNTVTGATSNSSKKISKTATIVDCAPATSTITTPQSSPIKPKNNERTKLDLANCMRLNEMRYSFERVPVTDLWYRVFMRQDTCTERFFEYYGSTNYRKLPYELGPIPYARTLNNGVCCKLCDKDTSSKFMWSNKEAKSKRCFASSGEAFKVKREPVEQDSEAGASKSRDSSSGKSNDMVANAKNPCTNLSNIKSLETCATSATTTTTISNSTINTIQYTHKHKKLAFLHRYRQEQQELQKRQTAATSEQPLNSTHPLGDNSNQCDSNVSMPTVQERIPRERKRAGSTHSTTSSTSCASSTATSKTSKNRYFNKHLNKAATAFLNLELPPRKSPREHASTLALVSCIIKQRQDSQSKPNSETDEPPTSSTQMVMLSAGSVPTEINTTTKPPSLMTESGDGAEKSSTKATTNSEFPTTLRSPRHTRSAAATPVEEMRFTTVISENVKRMRRGQNKYDHSPPIAHTQRSSISRKTGRGRPPRKYCGLQKFLNNTESAVAVTNRTNETSSSVLMASAAPGTTVNTGDRRRRVKHGAGWTSTMGLMAGGRRRQHSNYTGLLAQGSALPSIRKTGSKKGVLEFEVDATALKALDAAAQYTNVRHLEWKIDKYLQLYGREYDVDIADDLALSISESQETAPPAITSAITSTTRKCNTTPVSTTTTASASTSKKLKHASSVNVDVKHSASSSTALTQTAATHFDGSTNTPPPTDYFSSDFDLYDLFTNNVKGEASSAADDEQTADKNGKRKTTSLSLYSSLAMQNYFRKRKGLKSNRTGWPKVQKKKTSVRQQHMLARKIRFLQDIGELTNNNGNGLKQEPHVEGGKEGDEMVEGGDEDAEEAASTNCREIQRRRRGNGVITPPESEIEVKQNNVDDCGGEDTEIDAAESVPEGEDEEDEEEEELEDDGETMAETIDEEDEDEAEAEAARNERDADAAVEADEEDVEDAELDMDMDVEEVAAATACADVGDDDDTLMDDDSRLHVHATRQRNRRHRRRDSRESPLEEEKRSTTNAPITAAHISSSNNNNGATSTPTKQLLRGGSSSSALRRTPQLLNGSLGSCISPSEKAGDNSDIFTVSSDGLDTDLDMSNSQHKCDDEHLHHHHHHSHHHHHHHPMHHDQCANHQQTPKRKFDLSKYAPNNAASSSCAAEAATAAVKSLAISQFLKKEVRVQCRRLRAPFRRYRYRR